MTVDFKGTFIDVEYINIEDSEKKLIKTRFFTVETPRNWYFIDKGMGMDSLIGLFWTGNGFLYYDYGGLGMCGYDSIYCNIYDLEYKRDTINGYAINIGRNNSNMGFCIPEISLSFRTWDEDFEYEEFVEGLLLNNKWD